ncbi:hypothetical protein GCM10008014_12490 [Paenibacillus silvae]|uniref:Uncharacterized protein n=1 Tax=Paenibacillus silvae TaxID=1325358 RepID=A0ABQ1Z6B7_9BACL|nr:hypothetical protein GCM10008014_12490 [Paenibacillus silvae]
MEYTYSVRSTNGEGNSSVSSNSVKREAIKNYKMYSYNSDDRLMKVIFLYGKKIE